MKFAILLISAVLLAGCASSKSGDVYSRDQARREMTVRNGVVESVRVVTLEGTKSQVGTTAGAVVGGVAGSSVGQGKGSVIAAVIGAVAGGVAGSAIEEGATRKQALEITVNLDGGRSGARRIPARRPRARRFRERRDPRHPLTSRGKLPAIGV
jgi:outer membrane lipoprotein SlyB